MENTIPVHHFPFSIFTFTFASSVIMRAMSFLIPRPSLTFFVFEPAEPNLNALKASLFSVMRRFRSELFLFTISFIFMVFGIDYILETTFVLTGNFVPALRSASAATTASTPSISNMMRPGFTSAIKPTGSPFPFPIFTSAGFCVKG